MKKGHDIAECCRKKRDENPGEINMTKELACMYQTVVNNNDDLGVDTEHYQL